MKTAVLVRHADIDLPPTSADALIPLNAAGRQRAALARVVAPAGVAAVFTSSVLRTKQTVTPLAAARGLQPEPVLSLAVTCYGCLPREPAEWAEGWEPECAGHRVERVHLGHRPRQQAPEAPAPPASG